MNSRGIPREDACGARRCAPGPALRPASIRPLKFEYELQGPDIRVARPASPDSNLDPHTTMAIHVGDPAPDFTLKNQDEKEWKLSQHRGKNVVLLWYPLDWSPTCEKENCSISNDQTFALPDTEVVGISRDSTWSHKAWKKSNNLKHDLLADPTLDVTRKYDLVHPAGFISHRASVVVDKQGKVAFVQVQEKTPEARDMNAVATALRKLA